MELTGDLSAEELERVLPGRPIRFYPALLSTEADALAWARAGAPGGAVVAAEYQASPRGRAGLEWHPTPGESVAFSLVLRPRLPAGREGWLYTVAAAGLADVLGPDATIEWPDEVRRGSEPWGAVGIQTGLGAAGLEWAVVNVLVRQAARARSTTVARVVEAIEHRCGERPAAVLADYLRRCSTIGRGVRARLIPLGPGGVAITGRAVTARLDGSLVVERDDAVRIAVLPQSLGLLEEA